MRPSLQLLGHSALLFAATLFNLNPAWAGTYDLSAGFSTEHNPNGPWAYGYVSSIGSAFTPISVRHISTTANGVLLQSWQLTSYQTPAVYRNCTEDTALLGNHLGTLAPGTVTFNPGENGRPENYGVIRFTVPAGGAGEYLIETAVRPVYDGPPQGDTDFHVVKNGQELFGESLAPDAVAGYTNTVSLDDGETVDFIIGRGQDGSLDGSGLKISASLSTTNTPSISPAIVVGPQSQSVASGGNVTFSVSATGTPPLTYEWRFQDEALAGETNAVLALSNVQPNQAGPYSVEVANAFGSAISAVATLSVEIPPAPATFDLSRDFSAASNPHGVWSMGWKSNLDSEFNTLDVLHISTCDAGMRVPSWQFTSYQGPAVYHNSNAVTVTAGHGQAAFNPNEVWFIPGENGRHENYGVIRFTTPPGAAGNYTVRSAVSPVYRGFPQGDTDFHVIKNGAELFGAFVAPDARSGYTNVVNLTEGDTVEFVIGRGQDNDAYGSVLRICASIDFSDTNPAPPVIFVQPQSQSVQIGDIVSLRVTAGGTSPLGYRWQFNGEWLSDATNASLLLPNIQASQTGAYSVEVANAFGALTSAVANVTVEIPPPPSIVMQPESRTIVVGSSVTFQVVANGAPPLVYLWRFNGDLLPEATGATLTLHDVQFSQAGNYWAEVANAYGSITSAVATLTVVEPPVQVVHDYDLSREFSPDLNPSGAWTLGWKPALDGNFTALTVPHTSGTDNGVHIPSWQLTSYQCPAVYWNGSQETAIVAGGHGSFPPSTVWFYPGENGRPETFGVVRFTVPETATGSYRVSASVQPVYDGPIQGDTDFHVVRGGEVLFERFLARGEVAGYTNTLVLSPGDTIDFVIGRGQDGDSYGSGLKIQAAIDWAGTDPLAPVILVSPRDQAVAEGDTLTLTTVATGTAPLEYQWLFAGVPIAGATNSILALTPFLAEQVGEYSVAVANAVGSITSAVANVELDLNVVAPSIISITGNQTVAPGATVTLNVVALGTGPRQYQWFRNGAVLAGGNDSSLVVSNIQPADAGTYSVTVANRSDVVASAFSILNVNVRENGTVLLMSSVGTNRCPVFDADGVTKLQGTAYLAQLYGGPAQEELEATGAAVPFLTGTFAGFFHGGIRSIPNVPAGATAYAQVRAWESSAGSSFEEAQAAGGKVGWSAILQVVTGGGLIPPAPLIGLQSFSIRSAEPEPAAIVMASASSESFAAVVLSEARQTPTGELQFTLSGQLGANYLIEVSTNLVHWGSLTNLLNLTGPTPVVDSRAADAKQRFYRARLVD